MRRRAFIQSSSASIALALTGCGGGGGGGAAETASPAAAGLTPTNAAGTAVTASTAGTSNSTPAASTPAAAPAPTNQTSSSTPASTASSPAPAPAPSPAPAPAPAPARTSDIAYPFGARLDPYAAGILPSVAAAQMDNTLRSSYNAWKAANVVTANQVVSGGYAVRFGNSTSVRTVSEGMGYGMLITVLMAGHDPQAKTVFDGMFRVCRARPAYGPGEPALMDWRIGMDGSSQGGGWPAMDGDEDISLALLMADRQWGSDRGINYKQEAIATINAMKRWFMYADGRVRGRPNENTSRTSDFMFGHFRAYKKATNDTLWDAAVDKQIDIINRLQANFAPNTGLMPDFVKDTGSSPAPMPGSNEGLGDGTITDSYYFTNACRNPWRFGTDYVLTGDPRMQAILVRLMDFLQADCGGNPTTLGNGYMLNGTALNRSYTGESVVGPAMLGAMCHSKYQSFLNAFWAWNSSNFTTDYYDSELQLLPMIVASGNWWTP